MVPLNFTYLGREWRGEMIGVEADTPRVTPAAKGPPWPRREEYRGAVIAFRKLMEQADK